MRAAGRPLGIVALLLGLVLAALLATYWLGGGAVGSAPGDPTSPEHDGTAAVAAILAEHGGVDVRSAAALGDLGDTTGATVVIGTSRELPAATLAGLRDATTRATTVVLVRPHVTTLAGFLPAVREQGSTAGVLRAQCTGPPTDLADRAEEISGNARLYALPPSDRARVPVCFRQVGGGALPGAVVTSAQGDQRRTVVGNLDMFTNAHLNDVDNAAVAIRLLGGAKHLVWYTALAEPPATTAPGDAGQRAWPPAWLGPLTLAAAGAVVALMAWRGRRLGRLAVEPLPVIVQADETTLALARLYRRARDPAHAARVLQRAESIRLAESLALPPTADPTALADAAARATGRTPGDIRDLLTRSPRSDAELARLADQLTRLEKEVRRA